MADTVKSIFSPGKAKGPDPALIEAQRRQEESILRRDKEEERKRKARQNIIDANQNGPQNLFDAETGVADTLGG